MIDYKSATRGLLDGMAVGQQVVRQYQQDQRQAGMDQRALERETVADTRNEEEKAYRDEQRRLAAEERTERKSKEQLQAEANAAAIWLGEKPGADKISSLLRQGVGKDYLSQGETVDAANPFAGLVKTPEGRYVIEVNTQAGQRKPMTLNRSASPDDAVATFDENELLRFVAADYARKGADVSGFLKTPKAEALKIEEVGGKNGMKRKVIVNADGTTKPIGEEYPQFDPLRKAATDGSGGSSSDTQLMKNIKYFEDQGEDSDTAYILATQGVADRVGLASKLQASYLQSYDASLKDGPTREQLVAEANMAADNLIAKYFTKPKAKGKNAASPAPAPGGMASFPTFSTRPAYQGPVRSGAPSGMAAPAAVTPAQPQKKGKPIDRATASALLREVGGDKQKARQLAQQRGYTL
jgi:hypothetical protein